MRGWNIRLEKMFYTTWNILHLKVFTKSCFLFFQKIQKLTSAGDGGGVLIKTVQGGREKISEGTFIWDVAVHGLWKIKLKLD